MLNWIKGDSARFPFNRGDVALLLLITVADLWLGDSDGIRMLGIGALLSLSRLSGIYLYK